MHNFVTAENIKEKMANLKVKLYKIILAYSISGNGGNCSLVVNEVS